jgi:phage-related protein
MLKVRLQGTKKDIKWFEKFLEQSDGIEVLQISEPYANKGTTKYFRVYVEVEKEEQ